MPANIATESTQAMLDQVLGKLGELGRIAQGYSPVDPEGEELFKKAQKDRVDDLMQTKHGQQKLAATAIGIPLRKFLRQRAQGRNWVAVHEDFPIGIDARLDWAAHHLDSPNLLTPANELLGIEIGNQGTAERYVLTKGEDTVKFFTTANRLAVNMDETYRSTYDLLDYSREVLEDAMGKFEDEYILSTFSSAAVASAQTSTTASVVSKQALFNLFYLIERNRLTSKTIVAGPGLSRSMGTETWDALKIGFDRVQDLTDNGYLGVVMGKDLYQTSYLTSTDGSTENLYVLTDPAFLAYMPIRQDLLVRLFEDPSVNTLETSTYQHWGLFLINNMGVARLSFSVTATT